MGKTMKKKIGKKIKKVVKGKKAMAFKGLV